MSTQLSTATTAKRETWFGRVDSRPLSLFRIAFALFLLKDALYHLPLALEFYSDEGVVPRAALMELGRANRFSLMDAMPYWWMAALVFIAWFAVAACLLVGWRTRLMTVLNFVLILSIHERNVYVLTGADSILRALSFWAMFIPLGQHYSLDAALARRRGDPLPSTVDAFPVRMIQLQVALVYVFAGLLKLMGESWRTGEAIGYVFQLETTLLPLGALFRAVAPDAVLRTLTLAIIVIELLFIVLVFSPVGQPLMRRAGLVLGAVLHIGIGVMLVIPDFSLLMLISYLTFVEPEWVDWLERRFPRVFGKRIEKADREMRPHPLIGQGDAFGARSVKIPLSNHLPEFGEVSGKPAALDAAPHPQNTMMRRVVNGFLAVMMALTIWWNIDYLGEYRDPIAPMPDAARAIVEYSGLWQYWDLFAPLPYQIDGWTTIPGRFEDGREIDLRTGAPPSTAMQREVFGPRIRWEKFEENVFNNQYEPILRAWGAYYCHQYNDEQALPEGQRLATLEIHFRYRRSHAPGEPVNPYQDERMWTHWCYAEYAY